MEPVTSPEDSPVFSESLSKEKTMVEIFLRKYGFGQWKPPLEVGAWRLVRKMF